MSEPPKTRQHSPEYQAVLDAAALGDIDAAALQKTVADVIQQTEKLASDALRVRGEQRKLVDALKAELRATTNMFAPATPNELAMAAELTSVKADRDDARADYQRLALASRASDTAAPESLVAWARHEVRKHPTAVDEHVLWDAIIVGGVEKCPAMRLGHLRAWLKAIDA